ncbi:MAG: CDP-alcohol phosphatidyltransferase family protein [Defluviitaleaceae bacterium]|nr:CDP-alcohol phosphatidyltransferase family protein [Defluviitaleaceae bacterium]
MFTKKYFPIFKNSNIPNLITTLGLLFGIAACYFLTEGDFRWTLICLSLAMLMDFFDGFFAGKLNSHTSFGKSLDSLVDFFVCCIMPVLMVYIFVGSYPILIAAVAFYCICGLWRLAHYNSIVTTEGKRTYFTGLPVPAAALLATMAMWAVLYHNFHIWFLAAAFITSGFLMVSFLKLEKYGLWQKIFLAIGGGFWIVIVAF